MTIKEILALIFAYLVLRDIVLYAIIPFGKFLARHHKQMLIDHEHQYRAIKEKNNVL